MHKHKLVSCPSLAGQKAAVSYAKVVDLAPLVRSRRAGASGEPTQTQFYFRFEAFARATIE
jgi:hypothetical protein